MTAYRVISKHSELCDVSGTLTHQQIDGYLKNTPFLVVSGTEPSASLPPDSRQLVAGPGIIFTDHGPGKDFVVSVDPSFLTGSFTGSLVFNERPSGSIDGVNTMFGLINSPNPSGSLMLFLNGVLQEQGPGDDYLLSGSTITFFVAPHYGPRAASKLLATYQK